jgi:DNA-directed RNA polymerase specialized sigma24 family protein
VAPDSELEGRRIRRRLVELTGSDIDPGELPASSTDPEGRLRAVELRRALAVVLSGLEPSDRLLLKLRFEDGLNIRDIADAMHFPTVFHVYRRLRTVLDHARGLLLAHGIDEPAP